MTAASSPELSLLFRLIADSTYDWETWVDERGVARWVNPAVARITGYSVEECLAMPDYPLSLAHTADRALLARILQSAARGATGNDVEFRIVHKAGEVRWVAVSFQGVRSPDGQTLGYRTSIRDIDERKRMERELHAIRRKAEALAQARSELLANVSHELRSPAHCIAGFVELLSNEPLPEKQRRYVEIIGDQCHSMLRQVEDLLSLTALEAGGVELMLGPLELPALVSSLIESAMPTARARGIELRAEFALAEPWVEGDALRLKQILQNLVDNALKFTERGSVVVYVRDARHDPSQPVTFEVRDTGIGMAQADVSALLAPFRQGDSGSSRRHGGVGLGLAIVDRLVSAMGGKLEIESAVGQGTCVRFQLPLARAESADRASAAVGDEPSLGVALVVDDSAPARELLQAMLKLVGIETYEASHAEQARAIAAHKDVDVVFLDYQMPDSDGAQTAAMLRRVLSLRNPTRRIPIFILTANVFAREQLKEADESVDGVLTKPLSRAALARLVRNLRQHQAEPARSSERLDRALVDDLAGMRSKDGRSMLAKLLPDVMRDMDEALEALSRAEAAHALELVAKHAHAAAGHAGIVGAQISAETARRLEDAARAGTDISELAELRAALVSDWLEARAELEAYSSSNNDVTKTHA